MTLCRLSCREGASFETPGERKVHLSVVPFLSPGPPSPIYLSYDAADVATVLALRERALARTPNLDFRDYTVRADFDGAGADALRQLILTTMAPCRSLIVCVGAHTWTDAWVHWQVTVAQGRELPVAALLLPNAGPRPRRPNGLENSPIARGSLHMALRLVSAD